MLSREWLQAFVPLGILVGQQEWRAVGAGVVFLEHDILWLVTARHVVANGGAQRIAPIFDQADNTVGVVPLGEFQRFHSFGWIEDKVADLAVSPLPAASGARLKAVTRRDCILIKDLVPSMPSYTVGCPYGVVGLDPARPRPLVLDGVVSGTRESDNVIFTSAPTFPGNSGGPLVVYRSPFNAAGGLRVGQPPVLFAGIVLATTMVPSPDRNAGLPPLHLGMVRSADVVLELLGSAASADLAARLKGSPNLANPSRPNP